MRSYNTDSQDPQQADTPILLFDGICLLCSRIVHFVIRNEARPTFRFAALQSDAGHRLLHRHGLDTASMNTFYVLDADHIYNRSDAVIFVANRLTWPWRIAKLLAILPRRMRDTLYRAVAENRYALFGQAKQCAILPTHLRDRILE